MTPRNKFYGVSYFMLLLKSMLYYFNIVAKKYRFFDDNLIKFYILMFLRRTLIKKLVYTLDEL